MLKPISVYIVTERSSLHRVDIIILVTRYIDVVKDYFLKLNKEYTPFNLDNDCVILNVSNKTYIVTRHVV